MVERKNDLSNESGNPFSFEAMKKQGVPLEKLLQLKENSAKPVPKSKMQGDDTMPLKIKLLEDVPEYLPEVAERCFNEWPLECKTFDILSVEDYATTLRKEFNGGQVLYPFTLVGIDNLGKLYGTISCIVDDMPDRPQYSPWLASLLVMPEARGKGVANDLIDATKERAAKCGVKTIYLWCIKILSGIYSKKGFVPIEEREFCGNEVVIMKHDF